MQAVQEIRRALRMTCSGKDRALVLLEHLQPGGDIGGVVLANLRREIKVGASKGGADFATSSSIA